MGKRADRPCQERYLEAHAASSEEAVAGTGSAETVAVARDIPDYSIPAEAAGSSAVVEASVEEREAGIAAGAVGAVAAASER